MCIGGPFIAGLLKAAPHRFLSAVMLQPVGIDGNQEAFYDMFNNWTDDLPSRPEEETLKSSGAICGMANFCLQRPNKTLNNLISLCWC